jgi:hypothetical protein
VLAVIAFTSPCFAQALPPLPEGSTGIAAQYPGDEGIGQDSGVIFADDFEAYTSASQLNETWNAGVYHHVTLTAKSMNVFSGKQSLQFYNPLQEAELSNGVSRRLEKDEELDVLFLRYYGKIDESYDVVGSSHNGAGISAHYFKDGQATPGIPADGTNKFLAELECWRGTEQDPSPGNLNVYIYHPEQRSQWGDHFFPTGTVLPNTSIPGDFGDDFTARPDLVPELGQWYCFELMLKANTPGERDGRIGCWVDGNLVADFPNLRLRDVDSLTIDRFGLSMHIKSNTAGETWKWCDNVVAATSYIGPMTSGNPVKHGANKGAGTRGPGVSTCGTVVSFFLHAASTVTLDMYSVRGELVRSIDKGTLAEGRHTIRWDGRDGEGVPVAAGTYMAAFRIGENSFVEQTIVTR